MNPDLKLVEHLIAELPLACLQFHGNETPQFCSQFNMPYIKAIPAIDRTQLQCQINEYQDACGFLVDTPANGVYGGTGQSFDWTMLPSHCEKPMILAGGLNVLNVQQAVTSVRPYAIDVCSGIEKSPGIKDHVKMKAFMAALTSLHSCDGE